MQAGEVPGNKANSGVLFINYYAAIMYVPKPKHLRVYQCMFCQALLSTTAYCIWSLVEGVGMGWRWS